MVVWGSRFFIRDEGFIRFHKVAFMAMEQRDEGFIRFHHFHTSGQIIATSHDLGPQKVAEKGKSPYFREIQVKYYNLTR